MGKTKSDFVMIHTVQGEITAQVIKSHLESEGIPVFITVINLGLNLTASEATNLKPIVV